MALIPLIFDLAEELASPAAYNDFGFGIYPHELIRVDCRPIQRHRLQPKSRFRISSPYSAKKLKPGDIQHVGKDGFQVSMDVQQFRPNEITVKTVDNTVVIEAKHEEREDEHGTISRHFVRKYTLPKGYDSKDVVSTISSDGILTVKAPLPPEKKSKCKERVVQIQQTGPACDSIKANSCEESKSQEMNGNAQR